MGITMNKQEFINRLHSALNGNVSPGVVQENVNYYEDYINMEIRKGRGEEEVLLSLGEPRLIARTIIETNGKSNGAEYRETGYQSYDYQNANHQGSRRNNGYYDNPEMESKGFRIPGWAWAIIIILILVMIFSLIFSVLSFLAPVILPIIVVVFLVKLFRDWLN